MAAWNGGVGAVGSSPPLAPSHHGHGHGRMPTAAALRPSNGDGGDNYMMHSQLLGLPPMPCPGQVPTQRRSVSSTSSTSSASAGSDSISSSGGGAATMAAAAAITTQWGAQADGQQQQQLQVTTATAPSPSPSLDQMLARLGASTPTSALTATAAAVMMAPIAANVSTAGATASSGGVYCARCGSARPDVRFPCCGFRIHGRCLVGGGGDQAPWPCRACPGCGEAGGGEGGSGGCVPVEVPLPEPFRRNGEDVRVPPNELAKVRGGRWQEAEVRFAEMVLELFGQGALPMKDGARLGTVLCSLLQCSAARLSSKLRTGKVGACA